MKTIKKRRITEELIHIPKWTMYLLLYGMLMFGLMGFSAETRDWRATQEFDCVEIKEGLDAGLLSLTFNGSEDGKEMSISIYRTLDVPLFVVIDEGSTTFSHKYGDISIMVNEKVFVDLSDNVQDTIVVSQTGKKRLHGTMTQRARFSDKTAAVYSKLMYSKDSMLEQLITVLDHEDAWLRSGAVEALGEIGDNTAIKKLELLIANDPDRAVRSAAAEALEKLNQKAN